MADIKAIITNAANRYGVDPDTALRIANIESRLDPSARNSKSGASGLFQFIPDTWAGYGNGRSPFDPEANADAGMRFIRDNMKTLRNGLGRDPTPGEIYMAHQQGAGGALNILRDPTAPAYQKVGRKQVAWNLPAERQAEAMNITAGDFATLWAEKMGDTNYSAKLFTGGEATGSVNTESTFRAGDGLDPTKTNASYGEIDITRRTDAYTEALAEKEAQKDDKDAPGFLEGAKLAIQNEWSVLAPFRALGHQVPDTNYTLDEEELKRVGEDIPTEYLDEFADAVSSQHADAIRERIIRQLDVNQKLGKMGATGVGLQIAAAMTDPGAWAATLAISAATGGVGAPAALAARFGRVGTVALGALEGVAGNLATDVPLYAVDPTKTKADLMYSIGTGIVMGGMLNGYGRANRVLAEENQMIEDVGIGLTANKAPASAGPDQSVGAARSDYVEPTYRSDAAEQTKAWRKIDRQYKLAFGRVRFDLSSQLLKSQNPAVRGIGRHLVEDAVGNGMKDQVSVIAASEVQRRLQRVANFSWAGTFNEQWEAYRKANKIGLLKSRDAQADFSAQITAWQRASGEAKKAFPKEVQTAGAKFNTIMQDWWKQAREHGITRSELGAENYVPRITHREKAVSLISRYGMGKNIDGEYTGVSRLFIEAIRKEQPNIRPELAEKMGHAITDRMYKLGNGQEIAASRALSGEDLDDFRKMLLDARFDDGNMMSEADVEEIIANLKGTKSQADKEAGGSSRLKHRVLLDENFSMTIKDRDGIPSEVKISDFYVNDANMLMHLYNRNMSGQVALAGVKIPDAGIDGIRSASDFETLLEKVKGVADEERKAGKVVDVANDEKNLRFAYNAIAGIPNYDEIGNWPRFLRLLRDFNFTRLMGQVGFSQIPEGARIISQMGFKTAFTALPEFRRIVNMARSGKKIDGLQDDLDDIIAGGREFDIDAAYVPTDSFGIPLHLKAGGNTRIGRAMDWLEPKLHTANRAVSIASGMAPINGMLQKWAGRAFAQKFAQMAKGGKSLPLNRLRLLGLDDDKLKAIKDAINAHATFDGNKLTSLGLGNWPVAARGDFADALNRASRNIILENDVGQFSKLMLSPLGKVLLQFRSFAVGAWTRGLLQGANHRDLAAGVQFATAALVGSLVYYGQTKLQLLGDPDKQEKEDERLGAANLLIAGLMRTSESSLLPMLIDTTALFTTGETALDYRSSGLTGLWGGNPTLDLIDKSQKAVSGITTALAGDDYSKPDAKAGFDILPFQRTLLAQWFFNLATQHLPRRELRD